MQQSNLNFQNWLSRYEAVLFEGFKEFGAGPMTTITTNRGGIAPRPYRAGNGAQGVTASAEILTKVTEAKEGITAAEVRGLVPHIKPAVVLSALARLAGNGSIVAKGRRGNRKYYPPKVATKAANAS